MSKNKIEPTEPIEPIELKLDFSQKTTVSEISFPHVPQVHSSFLQAIEFKHVRQLSASKYLLIESKFSI